jgi:hypothetical protein
VAQEASASLLDCHGFSDFTSDALKPTFGVEPKRSALNVGGADYHAREAKFAGRCFGLAQHTRSQAAAAHTRVSVHAPELGRIAAVTLDAERTHDPSAFVG